MSEILGLDTVLRNLEKLPFTLREKHMKKALRVAGEFLKERMRERAPDYTGNLRREITSTVAGTTAAEGVVRVGPSKKAWYAHFIEFGTAGHAIQRKRARVLMDVYGTVYGTSVQHPGTKAAPFIRPTLDEHKDEARKLVGEALWEGIESELGGFGGFAA
jgi:HK97 gp10 family phage protein